MDRVYIITRFWECGHRTPELTQQLVSPTWQGFSSQSSLWQAAYGRKFIVGLNQRTFYIYKLKRFLNDTATGPNIESSVWEEVTQFLWATSPQTAAISIKDAQWRGIDFILRVKVQFFICLIISTTPPVCVGCMNLNLSTIWNLKFITILARLCHLTKPEASWIQCRLELCMHFSFYWCMPHVFGFIILIFGKDYS